MEHKKLVGKNIKEARIAIKLTQEEFAKHIGVSRASIANIEGGRHLPTIKNLIKIAQLTNHSPNRLLNLDNNNEPLKPSYIHNIKPYLLKKINNLPKKKQTALLNLINAW
jgi:transcriptional regulator with XRE-family HTH domain